MHRSMVVCGFPRLLLRHVMPYRATDNRPGNSMVPCDVSCYSANSSPFDTTRRHNLTGAEIQCRCNCDIKCFLH
jgi:hypothetical protein